MSRTRDTLVRSFLSLRRSERGLKISACIRQVRRRQVFECRRAATKLKGFMCWNGPWRFMMWRWRASELDRFRLKQENRRLKRELDDRL